MRYACAFFYRLHTGRKLVESASMYTSAAWQLLATMNTGGEEAIGVLPHAAIAHEADPNAIAGMGNVLSFQKEMGMTRTLHLLRAMVRFIMTICSL